MAPRDTRQPTLTIGQFARRTGLSPKALRLYDLSGLLPPADVDPVNGYRRYTADQLERARRISLLRQLEMQEGLTEVGSPREVYFADCATAAGDDPYAHVAQPVAT